MPERRDEWVPVAVWEVLRMVRRKDFVISVLLVPLLLIGSMLAVTWFKERDQKKVRRIAVVRLDPGGGSTITPRDTVALPPLRGFEWVVPEREGTGVDALTRAVMRGSFTAALVVPAGFARGDTVRMIVKSASPGWRNRVQEHLRAEARRERAAERGLDEEGLRGLDAPVALQERLANPAVRGRKTDRVAAAVLAMLLVMTIFVTNSYMAVGISGEKQARVTEVIVSAIRPQSWMDGKLVAYTVLGLLQAAIWAGSLLVASVVFARMPLPAMSPGPVLLSVLFTVVGFAFFTALYGLVLATIKDLQSTSKFQAYLILLPVTPFLFLDGILESPDALWAVVLSLVPFFSPILMPTRIALGATATWEVWVSLAVLVVSTHFMRLAAGHAFRIGMLMYGKDLSLPELVRWAKES